MSQPSRGSAATPYALPEPERLAEAPPPNEAPLTLEVS